MITSCTYSTQTGQVWIASHHKSLPHRKHKYSNRFRASIIRYIYKAVLCSECGGWLVECWGEWPLVYLDAGNKMMMDAIYKPKVPFPVWHSESWTRSTHTLGAHSCLLYAWLSQSCIYFFLIMPFQRKVENVCIRSHYIPDSHLST